MRPKTTPRSPRVEMFFLRAALWRAGKRSAPLKRARRSRAACKGCEGRQATLTRCALRPDAPWRPCGGRSFKVNSSERFRERGVQASLRGDTRSGADCLQAARTLLRPARRMNFSLSFPNPVTPNGAEPEKALLRTRPHARAFTHRQIRAANEPSKAARTRARHTPI